MYANATEYCLVLLFQDRDTYRKNADDPVQDRRHLDTGVARAIAAAPLS
jgi:hypothetical protein